MDNYGEMKAAYPDDIRPARERGRIQQERDKFDKELAVLAESFAALRARLEPVLQPAQDAPMAAPINEVPEPRSELACVIDDWSLGVRRLTRQVTDVSARIDL